MFPSRAHLAWVALPAVLSFTTPHATRPVQASPLAVGSEPTFLAEAGPTSGSWDHLGLPWFSADPETGKAFLAFMRPQGTAWELAGRELDEDLGWMETKTVLTGFSKTPWFSVGWAPKRGPVIQRCEQGVAGHHHPMLWLEHGVWNQARKIEAPEGTSATGYQFPVAGTPFLNHECSDGNDPQVKRMVEVELAPGGEVRETFRFRTGGAAGTIRSWERADGTKWCAATLPLETGTGFRVVAQRRDVDGTLREPLVLAEASGPTCDLAGTASKEGWACVVWRTASEPGGEPHLWGRVKTPDQWLPAVALGSVTEGLGQLRDRVTFTEPDARGRFAVAWQANGTLVSKDFDPVQGWSRTTQHGHGNHLARWAYNDHGERLLVWGPLKGSSFWEQRWTPDTGWGSTQVHMAPMGRLPQPVLFNNGRAWVVGLADAPDDRVRPWSLRL